MLQEMLTALRALPAEMTVLIVAALPIIELRGAIPVGLGLGLDPWPAVVWGVVGNLLPVPAILAVLGPLRRLLADRGPAKPFFDWLERRVMARRQLVDRYGPWGLALFVGVPLPMTGAWTGAALAVVLNLPWHRALLGILLGVLMAGGIIGVLSTLGWMALR